MEIICKVETVNGKNVVSSRDIAEGLGKQHRDVLGKIREILTELEYSLSSYVDKSGKKNIEYLLDKDAFILLVMNYQGYNEFKRAYIKRFNELEEAVKNPLDMLLSMSKEELVGNVLQLAQIVKEKDEIIEQQKPAVDFTNRLLKSKDNILVREYAKILQDEGFEMGEKKLYSWLRDNKYLNKNNEPYQAYMKYFVVVEKTINTPLAVKTVFTTKITPAGQVYFWSKLNNAKEINELENKYEEFSPF